MNAYPRPGSRVLVVGSINVDQTVRTQRIPAPGETVTGSGPEINPGGKGANQAVAAARLGATVAMVGAVGRDAYAEVATRELRAAGVDLTHLLVTDGPCGMAFITVDTTGAGDAFVGALASALANGDTLVDAAKLAVRVGAYACTGQGAQPSYPTSIDQLPGGDAQG